MAMQKERRAASRKPQTGNPARSAGSKTLSHEDLYNLIAETAYFKAKARGFSPGGEVQDWIEAEAEIRHRIQKGVTR